MLINPTYVHFFLAFPPIATVCHLQTAALCIPVNNSWHRAVIIRFIGPVFEERLGCPLSLRTTITSLVFNTNMWMRLTGNGRCRPSDQLVFYQAADTFLAHLSRPRILLVVSRVLLNDHRLLHALLIRKFGILALPMQHSLAGCWPNPKSRFSFFGYHPKVSRSGRNDGSLSKRLPKLLNHTISLYFLFLIARSASVPLK